MMRTLRAVRLLCALIAATALALALRFALVPPVGLATPRGGDEPATALAGARRAVGGGADGDSLARAITARNPFRLHRSAAAAPFDPERPEGAPSPPAATRPAIALAGIVLGAEPAALLDGLPGVEGTRLLRLGESVAGYTLRAVTSQGAVLRAPAPDTTLILRVRSTAP